MSNEYMAVVVSDTHLDRHAWASRPELCGDSIYAFEQIYDFAEKHEIPVILAGDVFDKSYVEPWVLQKAMEQIDRWGPTWFIQGQHEFNRRLPWLTLAKPRGQHVHHKMFDLYETRIYGLDFTSAANIKEELASIPKDAEVLIAHQVWQERMGDYCGAEAAFKDVPYVKTIISGDFHKHCITQVTATDGRTIQCVSPGSTCLRAIDEDSNKYFFVWKKDGSFESVKLKSRPTYRMKAVSPEVFEKDLTELKKVVKLDTTLPVTLQKPILQVEFYDNVPDVAARVTKAIGDGAFLFFKALTNNAKTDEQIVAAGESYQSGLAGHLHLAAEPDSATFQTAMRLLHSTDRQGELKAVVQERWQ